MSSRLADRLSAARHKQFVGRDNELALFQSVLTSAEFPFFVLYVFGPSGVELLGSWLKNIRGYSRSVARLIGIGVASTPQLSQIGR